MSRTRSSLAAKNQVEVSFVIPVFNEHESLRELFKRIVENSKGLRFEILFIDDGSNDDSLQVIKTLSQEDARVFYISFKKNMGKAAALEAGFRNSRGEIVITMDADLQDDPVEIPRFIRKIQEGYDLVSGWKFHRLDPLEKRIPSKLFNKTVSIISGIDLHDFNCGYKAYRKEVVDAISLYGELHRFIPLLANRKGFSIAEIKVQHNQRIFGKSKYGFSRYFRGLFDALTVTFLNKYRDRPMHFFGVIGLSLMVFGFVICLYLSIQWLNGEGIGGRPLLLLGVLLLISGGQSFSVGLIGEMIVDANAKGNPIEHSIKENNLNSKPAKTDSSIR